MKKLLLTILVFLSFYIAYAQTNKDSLDVTNTFEEIITVCNSAMPESENQKDIIFERLSPYILYTGTDAARNNKVACDYNKNEDRKIVDKWGNELKIWLDLISEYKVIKFQSVSRDNLPRFIITVTYKPLKNGKNKILEFIKIKERYLLIKFE